jgi:putative phage-type endonuclease
MIEQRTEEWFTERLGKVTASRISDVLAKIKTGEASARREYRMELVIDRLTGKRRETYCSASMQWGIDHEEEARLSYAFVTDRDVQLVGFLNHPDIPMAGASPDGLVDVDGIVEIKCPNTATHVEYILGGAIPKEYQDQMLWQMEVAKRKWCDFVSYDPRVPQHLRLFVKRFYFDEERVSNMRDDVIIFLAEVDDIVNRLTMITNGGG